MKIAFLTPEFPHPKTGASGGIGTSILNLSKGLVNLGHQPVVLVYGQNKDEVFHENGITFHRIKNVKFKGFSWYLTRKKIAQLLDKLYAEKQIDLVEAPDWTGITSFIKPKAPLVIRLNGSDTYFCHLDNRPVKWINRFHEQRALQNADHLISVSQYTADMTKALFALDRDFTIIPNSIDAAKFAVSEPALPDNQTILYFGTLIRKKGLLELPHIFNAVHQKNASATLILVGKDSADIISGSDSTWEMMKPMFSESAFQNVQYLGVADYQEIKNHINKAAVCVFPTFAEALPVSWIEAMAMQKPIVASNIGWAKEVVDDGKNGFLVHPQNHQEFADKILNLLKNPDWQQEIGKSARQTVLEKFDIEVIAQKSINCYKSLLKL